MTTYILVGGAERRQLSCGQSLAEEVAKSKKSPLKILSCFFAEPKSVWKEKFSSRELWFKQLFGEASDVVLASPDSVVEQIIWADIIYLHGGIDDRLAGYLDNIPHLSELWGDKIVIGSSAGADYLAKQYWTCDDRTIGKGSGLVNINIITHFESEDYGKDDPRGPIDWDAAKQELQQAVPPGELVTLLREGQFVVIEQ